MHRPLQNPWTRGELRLPKKQRTRVVRRNIAGVAAVALLFCCLHGGAAQYDTCTNGTVADIGNGQCDAANNNPSCGYDGGDCCPCTCDDSSVHSCADNEFNCIFPECDEMVATSEGSTCIEGLLDDGFCDDGNNNPSCDYDGGDCCMCTCTDDDSVTVCGSSGFNCRDPACFDPAVVAEFPECTGDWLMVGDGKCQADNNNPSCGYDGGDCCPCSCSGSACLTSRFDECLDPDAEDEFFECKAPPPSALPCSADVQRTWVVDNSAKAKALAAAVNCSGGSFEVEWRGSVVVEDGPIYVTNGTILTITGVGSDALIDGNASTRLFTVVDASLHVSGVTISYGVSTAGGAIAAAGSSLMFHQTNFIGNTAAGRGGAIYVLDGSIVSCDGAKFIYNTAGSDGGAMYVTGSSVVSCGGSWFENVAGDSGGALVVDDNSSVSWSDGAVFAFNAAKLGGAVYAVLGSSVSWNAPALFFANSGWFVGGAVYIARGSSISWTSATTFDSNSAGSDYGVGGALAMYFGSNVSWSGVTTYTNNFAGSNGGGVYLSENSRASSTDETISTFSGNSAAFGGAMALTNASISIRGNSTFHNNTAMPFANSGGYGGAVFVFSGSTATWYGISTFTGNTAVDGGAMYVKDSTSTCIGTAMIALNSASDWGGAQYAFRSTVSWLGETRFSDNSANVSGGAVCAFYSNISWVGETSFLNNSASKEGGALCVSLSSVSLAGETEVLNNSVCAVYTSSSTLSWSGNTTLSHNHAADGLSLGGALAAVQGSRVAWGEGATRFIENYAAISGGAIVVSDSEVSWTGDTEFVGNSCEFEGSAISAESDALVSWGGGTTRFTRNNAGFDGTMSATDSNVTINGATAFSSNAAGANGGGLALTGTSTLSIGTVDASFVGNSAAVAGGAIFLSGPDVGPIFSDVSLISNSAAIGGAISAFSTGNKESGGYSTKFNRCRFVGNRATAIGGAINSVAGKDEFDSCVFEDNSAGTGGALRLAGEATVHNCSFVENTSNDGEGAAVSNIGYLSKIDHVSFSGNSFDCPSSMYLHYNAV